MRAPFSPHFLLETFCLYIFIDFFGLETFWQVSGDISLWFWYIYFSNNLWCWASYHVPVIAICMSCLVSLGILPIFQLGLFWALWASCVLWVLTSSQSYHLQIFSTIWCVVYCFFCCAKTVKFDVVPLVYFCCYFFCLKKLIQENIAMVYVRVFCLCSLLGGSWNSVFPLGL